MIFNRDLYIKASFCDTQKTQEATSLCESNRTWVHVCVCICLCVCVCACVCVYVYLWCVFVRERERTLDAKDDIYFFFLIQSYLLCKYLLSVLYIHLHKFFYPFLPTFYNRLSRRHWPLGYQPRHPFEIYFLLFFLMLLKPFIYFLLSNRFSVFKIT